MAYGLPYMGSKSIYAKKILEALPKGRRLVDLFAGGCSITDCAIKNFSYKWWKFLVNDVDHRPVDLFMQCFRGECPVPLKWISREEFKASKDYTIRLVWSFSNNGETYLYSDSNAKFKKAVWDFCVFNDVRPLGDYDICIDPLEVEGDLREAAETRRQWWLKNARSLVSKDRCSELGFSVKFLTVDHGLEQLNRLHGVEHKGECLDRVDASYLSYTDYEYQEGDVVYCDIPYKNTKCDQYAGDFDHDAFWEWASSRPYPVYVSERTLPDVPHEILLVKDKCHIASGHGQRGYKIEYLIKVGGR